MRRTITLIAGAAGAVILSKLVIVNLLGIRLDTLVESSMARAGTGGGAIAVVTLLAADLFLPIPSSLIMVLSGALFGVLWGALALGEALTAARVLGALVVTVGTVLVLRG